MISASPDLGGGFRPPPLMATASMTDALLRELALPRFRQRPPWWGPDLQTLRDSLRGSLRGSRFADGQAQALPIALDAGDCLLAQLDRPPTPGPGRALVLVCHGLGGSSQSEGPRRLAMALRQEGMAVLRLNLRGAGAGRPLATGSYAADCSRDLLPVLHQARILAAELGSAGRPLPLAGAGISLGGTILLNATAAALQQGQPGLDALVCISSPLDLAACALAFERPRNHLYQRWLVRRLRQQVLADPHGLSPALRQSLSGRQRPRSIRAFDALITAPRWGHGSVDAYYATASPLRWLSSALLPLPATLLVHAGDDPWVPAEAIRGLQQRQRQRGADLPAGLEICLADHGGHNGFHGSADSPGACWSDRLTARWLRHRLAAVVADGA